MTSKNSTSPKSSNQEKEIGHIKYSYEESFKRENISLLDDSVLIKNYNDSLKSPQSRRFYKTLDNEDYHDTIMVQNILPLDKISV